MNGIVVFDSTGKLLTRFGRSGQGPGEFGGLGFSMTIGRGDTLFVCGARQCQLFSPSHDYVRSIPVVPGSVSMGAAVFANGDIAFRMRSSDSVLSRNPVHRISTTGALVKSFGAASPIDRSCTLCVANTGFGIASNRRDVWVAPAARYALELWSGEGTLLRRLVVRNSPWFHEWNPAAQPARVGSVIKSVHDGGNGVLFVFGSFADSSAGPRVQLRAQLSAAEAALVASVVPRTPQIDAIDIEKGAVLASLKAPGIAHSTFDSEYLVTARDGVGSTILVDVWKVRFMR
jgi:hypothetical protein